MYLTRVYDKIHIKGDRKFMKRLIIFLLSAIICISNFAIVSCADEGIQLQDLGKVSTHTLTQKGLLSSNPEFYFIYGMGVSEQSAPAPIKLNWSSSLSGEFEVELSENEEFTNPKIYKTISKSLSVTNLKIGTTYYWRVSCNGVKSSVGTFTTEGCYPRNLSISGVTNVRDLGGYVTADEKTIKQGLLFRGVKLTALGSSSIAITEEGAKTLVNELGVKTEIDLRLKKEIGKYTDSILNTFSGLDRKVQYINCPIDYSSESPFYFLMRDCNKQSAKEIYEILADESNYPIYFHCSIGTDRTGELADLIHYLCDVSEYDATYDYIFSNLGNIGSKRSPKQVTRTALKELITSKYGYTVNAESVANCLKSELGLTDKTLNNIVNILTTSSDSLVNDSYDNQFLKMNANSQTSFTRKLNNPISKGKAYDLNLKVKASKNCTAENFVTLASDKECTQNAVVSSATLNKQWTTINVHIPSSSEDYNYLKFTIPSELKGVDIFVDDVIVYNPGNSVSQIVDLLQKYDLNYKLKSGDDYVDNFDGSLNIASNVDESLASSTKSLVKKGDINKDSVVNLLDLCALLKIIGKNPVDISTYDVNNDGVVNIKDAETMMSIIFK